MRMGSDPLLGRAEPRVDQAAQRQQSHGDCLNGPTKEMVELAERMTDTVTHARLGNVT